MTKFEVHTMTPRDEDLGVVIFDDGELAIYDDKKSAQRVADGMNHLRKVKGCGLVSHHYVVVEKEEEDA